MMGIGTREESDRQCHGSLSQVAYQTIRDQILRGRLPLGTPLSRRKLTAELGMSLSPITEALQALEAEGFIEVWPRVGTRVKIPSPQEVRGRHAVRLALETESARLFAEKASAAEKKELRRRAADLDKLYLDFAQSGFNPDAWFHIHEQHVLLHVRIAECSGFAALADAVRNSHVLILAWMSNTGRDFRGLPSQRWHRNLMEVLASGDPQEAQKAMREHIDHGEQEVLRRLAIHARTYGLTLSLARA
jgi:DNA-binding GntR family transcriptional regulator